MTKYLIAFVLVYVFVRFMWGLERKPDNSKPPLLSTFAIESLGAFGRMFFVFLATIPFQVLRVMLGFASGSSVGAWRDLATDSLGFSFIIGFLPLLWAVGAVLFPGLSSGREVANQLGARSPSNYNGEAERIRTALSELRTKSVENHASFVEPETVLVIDNPMPNSYTVGRIVYLTSGLFATDFVKAALAHELGHLTNGDGRMLYALRKVLIPFAYWLGIERSPRPAGLISGKGQLASIDFGDDAALFYKVKTMRTRFILAFWFGGLGLLIKSREWAQYWKTRDFLADQKASALGEQSTLREFLEQYQELEIAHPYLLSGRPYAAERIDKLEGNYTWQEMHKYQYSITFGERLSRDIEAFKKKDPVGLLVIAAIGFVWMWGCVLINSMGNSNIWSWIAIVGLGGFLLGMLEVIEVFILGSEDSASEKMRVVQPLIAAFVMYLQWRFALSFVMRTTAFTYALLIVAILFTLLAALGVFERIANSETFSRTKDIALTRKDIEISTRKRKK